MVYSTWYMGVFRKSGVPKMTQNIRIPHIRAPKWDPLLEETPMSCCSEPVVRFMHCQNCACEFSFVRPALAAACIGISLIMSPCPGQAIHWAGFGCPVNKCVIELYRIILRIRNHKHQELL